MQKKLLSIVTISSLFFIQYAHAAKVEIDGESIDCDVKSFSHLLCEGKGANLGKKTIVISEDGQAAFGIEQDSKGVTRFKLVKKVTEGKKVLYQTDLDAGKPVDTVAKRIRDANTMASYIDPSIPESKEFAERAKAYLKGDGRLNEVKVKYNNKDFDCEVGRREDEVIQSKYKTSFDKNMKCPLFSCKGKDGETGLLHIPNVTGYGNTNLVIMKNGTAQYVDSGFTVTAAGSDVAVDKDLVSGPLALEDGLAVNSDLLIPEGYKGDKKTFLYMTNVNKDPYSIYAQKLCNGWDSVKKVIEEQKKIGSKLTEISEQQKLIEVVSLVDETLKVTLVDRTKGLKVGCLHNERIYSDQENTKLADSMERFSKPETLKKYVDEGDVQTIFNKVKYIPFGNSGLRSGAEARAYKISKQLDGLGLDHNKVWIKGNLERYWNYNVAVNIMVRKDNGEFESYIIDPATQKKAVPEKEWIASMTKKGSDPVMVTSYPIAENASHFHRNVIAYSSPEMYGFNLEVLSDEEKEQRAEDDLTEEYLKNSTGQLE